MKFRITLIKSIVGGFLIGLGGTCFLSIDNKIIGALLFSLGLLAICVTDQCLFTGKAAYSTNIKYLAIILLGNYIGATGLGLLIRFTCPAVVDKAREMCVRKLAEGPRLLGLALLCNILIYFAVEGYKCGHAALLVLCVMAFILCGFEHSIANMFYFSVGGAAFTPVGIAYLLANVFGNLCGGLLVQIFYFLMTKE